MRARMSTRRRRFLVVVVGLIGLFGVFLISRRRDDPLGWLGAALGVIGILFYIAPSLWDILKTGGRCIRAYCWAARVNSAWTRVVAKSGSEAELMMLAFLKRYTEEEVIDISAKSQEKHFVVTNFVAYSKLVDAIVHTACKFCPPDSKVACFTTLTMPLSKWFNFTEIENSPLRYCQVHRHWEEYTSDLRELKHLTNIRRCVLAVTKEFAKEKQSDPGFPFKGEPEMRKHYNYWILAPTKLNELKPVEKSDIVSWFEGPLRPLFSDLRFYEGKHSAYLILPDGNKVKSSLATPSDEYTWLRLGEVFQQLFHSRPDDATYKVYTDYEWNTYFRADLSPLERMPEDLFIVGLSHKATPRAPKWIFCLATKTDKALDKVALEFISESLNEGRWKKLTEYVAWLLDASRKQQLQDWLKKAEKEGEEK